MSHSAAEGVKMTEKNALSVRRRAAVKRGAPHSGHRTAVTRAIFPPKEENTSSMRS